MKNIKIGADPELFLERNGEIISAEGMIGGTKKKPRKISKEGHAVQEDNIMVEFNIPASETREDFVVNIGFVLSHLEVLADMKKCKLNYSASAVVDEKYLETDQAQEFGCEPDFNVYLGDENEPPEAAGNLRSCGGHIHIGWDNPSEEESIMLTYAMDMTAGLESLELDDDVRRREMYGKAGSFRFKEYGMEYRTLSNFWIKSEKLMGWAFDKAQQAVELVESGKIEELVDKYGEMVRKAIDTNDKQLAKHLLEQINKKELQVTI